MWERSLKAIRKSEAWEEASPERAGKRPRSPEKARRGPEEAGKRSRSPEKVRRGLGKLPICFQIPFKLIFQTSSMPGLQIAFKPPLTCVAPSRPCDRFGIAFKLLLQPPPKRFQIAFKLLFQTLQIVSKSPLILSSYSRPPNRLETPLSDP